MRYAVLVVPAAIFVLAASAIILAVIASVSLARDEDAHPVDCVAPCCDPGPDDLTALADAVGVLRPADDFALWEVGL